MMRESIKNIYEISGFGKKTSYEKGCQDMLQSGWDWMKGKKPKLKGKTLKNVYGIFDPDSPDARELSEVIVKAVPDCTGAMHQAVMGHLFYINSKGVEDWVKAVGQGDNGDL